MSDTAILTREDLPLLTKPSPKDWVRNLLRPFTKAAAVDQHHETDISTNEFMFKRDKTVLVVDDDPLFVKATCARLQADGYDVITATDSCQAMEALRCKRPDLVVLDVNLPDDVTGMAWDGLKLVAWLNRMEAFKTIPVVVVTASDASKYTRLALNAGATSFYHKRMEPTQLLTLLENSLARKAAKPPATPDSNFQI